MKLYEIVFSGELVPGAQPDRVQANLAKLFQADAQRVALLFSGRRLVLKNNLDEASAQKYRSTLERAGAVVEIVAMAVAQDEQEIEIEEVELAPPPDESNWARRAAAEGVASTRESVTAQSVPSAKLSLEPRDVYMAAFVNVQAPDFGLSELGENVQDPKAQPVSPQLDLSGLSLAPAGSDMGQVSSSEQAIVPDTSHLKLA